MDTETAKIIPRTFFRLKPLVLNSTETSSDAIEHIQTLTLQTLSNEPVDKWPTVVAERKAHEVMDLEPMRNIYVEPLSSHLQTESFKSK